MESSAKEKNQGMESWKNKTMRYILDAGKTMNDKGGENAMMAKDSYWVSVIFPKEKLLFDVFYLTSFLSHVNFNMLNKKWWTYLSTK